MLVTAIPNGTLLKVLKELLELSGVEIRDAARGPFGTLDNFYGLERLILTRPDYIWQLVSSGNAGIGITGLDKALEQRLERGVDNVKIVSSFFMSRHGFSKPPRVVIAVRQGDRFKDSVKKTVFCEYPNLAKLIIKKCQIIPSVGTTENMVAIGAYDYAMCLVDSGASLRSNNLEIAHTLLDVPVVCISRRDVDASSYIIVEDLCKFILGTLKSKFMLLLKFNVPEEKHLAPIISFLKKEGYSNPTKSVLAGEGYAIEVEVPRYISHLLEGKLSHMGAEKLLEVTIEGGFADKLPKVAQFSQIIRELKKIQL